MSSLIVEIVEIKEILDHPDADRLEIAKVKGWECVVGKGDLNQGDLVVYVPIDSVLPIELSDRLGVTKYLSKGRVRTAKLRGIYSQGLIINVKVLPELGDIIKKGEDVKDILGITKFIPPPPPANMSGEQRQKHPDFHEYTEIENIKNFPDVLVIGEQVSISEKIHGTNFRCGNLPVYQPKWDNEVKENELHVG